MNFDINKKLELLRPQVQIREALSQEDFKQVLSFCTKWYGKIGKTFEEVALTDQDTVQTFMFFVSNELTATVCISTPLEDELQMLTPTLPLTKAGIISDASLIVEVSRLCLKEEYRDSGLLDLVFEQIYQALVQSGRSYLVLAADVKLAKLYRRLGFSKSGNSYKKDGREIHIMILRQKYLGLFGLLPTPRFWNQRLGHIAQNLEAPAGSPMRVLQKALFASHHKFHQFGRGMDFE
jgi:predicted GNAT family N-acyltransferase